MEGNPIEEGESDRILSEEERRTEAGPVERSDGAGNGGEPEREQEQEAAP